MEGRNGKLLPQEQRGMGTVRTIAIDQAYDWIPYRNRNVYCVRNIARFGGIFSDLDYNCI